MASSSATNLDTLVSLKINIEGSNRRVKLPLRDLTAATLPDKLRLFLAIPPTSEAIFERYSDSAAAFIVLDPENVSVYKQLYRAAKAKLKLRLKVTVINKEPFPPKPATVEDEEPGPFSPVSPIQKPETRPLIEPIVVSSTPALQANSSMDAVEKPVYSNSVADIQQKFEELLIKYPSHKETPKQAPIPHVASSTEIPVTHGVAAHDMWLRDLTIQSQRATRNSLVMHPPADIFSVYCNNCQEAIPDMHYHCSTCDDGDFDLCPSCVEKGVLCGGEGHWMIKRFVKSGAVINSTTETIAPKSASKEPKTSPVVAPAVAPAVQEDLQVTVATRTCNSCVQELPEENFVTCTTCLDFDLCIPCHISMEHGHHPKHAFIPAVEGANLDAVAQALLAPGRNTSHNAICDGCDKYIYGVRHKCLDCPDWDFCSSCIPNANFIHPRHRFVPIYEPLTDAAGLSRLYSGKARHHGIYCDGPLCKNGAQTYIKGDRYKCAVCHDTDFCASCEASPSNPHNRTHPLIKFKTPVRNVSVTTLGDHEDGQRMPIMGDRHHKHTTSTATETTPAQSTNAATQVQTVADLEPAESAKAEEVPEVAAEEVSEPQPETKVEVKELPAPVAKENLIAHFTHDAVADGTIFAPNTVFEQTWYLRNGGTTAWPAGCSVKFVGGDNMCAVDPEHPASVHELVSAAESTTCYTEVAPGQETGFTVLMRTPNRLGNFISYWRLTGPHGNKFGHRLWCDVNVKEAEPAVKEEPKEEPKIEAAGSQMIFPKLEKESPVASIHEDAPVAAPVAESEIDEFDDFAAEIEDDETEDGFMTDEEYDILDASDEEYLAEQGKASK
jgi:next-to-BRCA1 protein 1